MSHKNMISDNMLLKSGKKSVAHLPSWIVKRQWYKVNIGNIYDITKIWIVVNYKELSIFMKYLNHFYSNNDNRLNIPHDKLKKELLCLVYRNNMYYRSIVLPILLPNLRMIRVFMIDFGLIVNVCINDVYNIFEKHSETNVPRFAIRASLAYVSPYERSKMWSQMDVMKFCEIINGRSLYAKICEIDTKRSILYIEIQTGHGVKAKLVSNVLVSLGIAVYNKPKAVTDTENLTKYKSKVKYLHLFPCFEQLEEGTVPCSLWEHELLKDNVPLDILYKNYFQYQNSSYDTN